MVKSSPEDVLIGDISDAVPITCVRPSDWPQRKTRLSQAQQVAADAQGFTGKHGQSFCLTSARGVQRVIAAYDLAPEPEGAAAGRRQDAAMSGQEDFALGARLAAALPAGHYRFSPQLSARRLYRAALGWHLAHYRYDTYKSDPKARVSRRLAVPEQNLRVRVAADASATALVRDLVNTPAEDMQPSHIETATRKLAEQFDAEVAAIVGDALIEQNFPTIHAVGRAASDAPRLIELRWGRADHPKVTLVGKGVTFDTGGLNLKPGGSMRLMKKDMGGAAHVLGLAQRIMQARLPICLRVLIPAVENAISGDAFRPGDIIKSRTGITIEIGNTDAEGRLILCDALALADEEQPRQLIDFATLTGAARVALGPDIAPMYCSDDGFARAVLKASGTLADPIWRMPLFQPYMPLLNSPVADTNNISDGPFAGSITAALFLQKFVTQSPSWTHFDVFAWSPQTRPGRPVGGDAFAIRAVFDTLEKQFPI
ncbi:MAG: leucyl aminopeptidase family protein [Pseudomonadota bacterium]